MREAAVVFRRELKSYFFSPIAYVFGILLLTVLLYYTTEAAIQHGLEELMAGRTTIAVAHRLSTIVRATEILVLHHGEVRERGTHAELLALGGLYSQLYELQFVRAA